MSDSTTILAWRRQEFEARIAPAWWPETQAPVMSSGSLVYLVGGKVRVIASRGIGLVE